MGAFRRSAAAATLALLLALLLAPLAPCALLLADDGTPACCRGRCCCNGPARPASDCVRATCHCGEEHVAPDAGSQPDSALTPAPRLPAPAAAAPGPRACAPGPGTRPRDVPHPPPWRPGRATSTT